MATHLGLGKALRVMKNDATRSCVGNLKKDQLVDIIMSLAFTARAIPGVQSHLEAAHRIALASPAQGGGMEAALLHLKGVVWQSDPTTASQDGDEDGDDGDSDTNVQTSTGGDALDATEEDSSKSRPICRSLWRGKACENPDSCSRAHKPLCAKDECKTMRNPNCMDWHYKPKKKPSVSRSAGSTHPSTKAGNSHRGRSAPGSKSDNNFQPARHRSNATEKMYLRWKLSELKLSELKLKQSRFKGASYRDVLMDSTTASPERKRYKPPLSTFAPGPSLGPYALGPQPAAPSQTATNQPFNLGPIVTKLEAVVAALTAAGIMRNPL